VTKDANKKLQSSFFYLRSLKQRVASGALRNTSRLLVQETITVLAFYLSFICYNSSCKKQQVKGQKIYN
jgi:hypothetical protein